MVRNQQQVRIIMTAIAAGLLTVALVLTPHVEITWAIVIAAGIYCLMQVWKQGRNWWSGRMSKVARRERLLRVLASLMGLFLTSGTALFLYAFQCVSVKAAFWFVNAEYLMRSIVCSLDLFMLDIDSNVLDQIGARPHLKGLISIQAVLSFSCTVSVLISLAYARVMAYYRLHRQTTVNDEHNHLYVFFGINEPSKLLARSIRKKEGSSAIILFVEKSPVDDNDRGGWDSIVGMFTHKAQTFSDVDELDAQITFTETLPSEVDKDKLTKTDILEETNLIVLRTLIQRLGGGVADAQLHVFFFSETEDENLRAMSVLAADDTINAVKEKIQQRFYCHARRNGLNRVIEDIAVKRSLDVRIIDSAHLAVELLKTNEIYHPVRLVSIDRENPTTVCSEFHSLIVGFDEAGQDAFRFLYEFGSFVDSKATPENDRRSPFYCTVVDTRIKELKGYFNAFAPEVMKKTVADGVTLAFKKTDCRSSAFYGLLDEKFCRTLNYVVIAVGSDELGMTCAIRMFNRIRQYRSDMSKLRIFVRSYNHEKEDFMQKIASHYNDGYNLDLRNSLKGDMKEGYQPIDIIIPFGQNEQIYSYDMIIEARLEEDGRRFQKGYATMRGESELWDERRRLLMGYCKKEKDAYGNKLIVEIPQDQRRLSLNDIRSLRRKEAQDIANALHAATKLYLLRQTKPDGFDWQDYIERYFDTDDTPRCKGELNHIHYPGLDREENMAVLNLARLEHLRWNASHEMLGYWKANKDLHSCDERTREHNCLRAWNELDCESLAVRQAEGWPADYKSFDFGVVDISILLYKDKLLKHTDDGTN